MAQNKSKPALNKPKKHIKTNTIKSLENTNNNNNSTPQPKRPQSIQYEEGETLFKYRPSPSVPPIRAKFTDFLVSIIVYYLYAFLVSFNLLYLFCYFLLFIYIKLQSTAKENKITIADIPSEVSKKELLEMLQYLQGKSNLKDLTVRYVLIFCTRLFLITLILNK